MPTLHELEEYIPAGKPLTQWRAIVSRLEAATTAAEYDRHRHYGHGYAQALYDAGLINASARDELRGAMLVGMHHRRALIKHGV